MVIDNLNGNRTQALADTGAVNAVAVFDLEQGVMGGTLDEGVVEIQKAILLPFQVDAGMRAAIDKGMKARIFMHHKNIEDIAIVIELKRFAARVRYFGSGTENRSHTEFFD